ncbi:hypothetical protein ABIE41_002708 [Bosea sp. OAE506]
MPKLSIHFSAPPQPARLIAMIGKVTRKPRPKSDNSREWRWKKAKVPFGRKRTSDWRLALVCWRRATTKRPTKTMATAQATASQRGSRTRTLSMFWRVPQAMMGMHRPKVTSAAKPASLKAAP